MDRKIILLIAFCIIYVSQGLYAENLKKNKNVKYSWEKLVCGGQFQDLYLPTPIINGLESDSIWGDEDIVPRDVDNGFEQKGWRVWGGNPVLNKDGKYYLTVARWREGGGWQNDSEVALCVADSAIGPYSFIRTIQAKGHNPEVIKLKNGNYMLHTMWGENQTAKDMRGPWVKNKKNMSLNANGFFSKGGNPGANLTTDFRPDGSIILMLKNGTIAISNSGPEGPYDVVSKYNYDRATGYPEDPVIWRSRHQYHSVYNHDQDNKNAYMRSLDGINWIEEQGNAYDRIIRYTDGTVNKWYQMERPKIIQDATGRGVYMSFAVHDKINKHSKNIIVPLVKERFISILGDNPVTAKTRSVTLRIEAEDDFNPVKELDVNSLRLGAGFEVNRGGGYKVVSSEANGKDLLVRFKGKNGLGHLDYDLKLLGKYKNGELVFGYALLPQRSASEASLIATPYTIKDVDGRKVLESTIKNYGMGISEPQLVYIYEHKGDKKILVKKLKIEALKPYEGQKIVVNLGAEDLCLCEFEVVVMGSNEGQEYWRMENHTTLAASFKGSWTENDSADVNCYMKSEKTGTKLGDEVTYVFNGTRARVYGRIGRQMGAFAVYIDGHYIETVRCNYAPVTHVKIYTTTRLPEGKHTLKLVKTDATFNGPVAIDAFSFESLSNI